MLIWNDTVALGDTICTFPAMLRCKPAGIYWTNAAVGDLFPHEKYGIVRSKSPEGHERVCLHDYVRSTWGKPYDRHPTQMALEMCGFWAPGPVKPELVYPEYDLEPFDLIIAPYVMADLSRLWPLAGWERVVNDLGLRCASILGSIPSRDDLMKIEGAADLYIRNHEYQTSRLIRGTTVLQDRPLTEIAWYMSKAKLVITTDSGPSRMMHGIGTPHLILCNANTAPMSWVSYPGAKVLHCQLGSLLPETVVSAARSILCG